MSAWGWAAALSIPSIGVILLGVICSITSSRASKRDWRKFTVGSDAKPVDDSRSSITTFRRIRGQS